MLRDRIRAVARLKGSTNLKSTLWQNLLLIVIGAAISFISAVTTNHYNSRNEDKKVALEQKVVFEKEVAAFLSTYLSEFGDFYASSEKYRLKANLEFNRDSVSDHILNHEKEFDAKALSLELLMSSYVDSSICTEFHNIIDNLTLNLFVPRFFVELREPRSERVFNNPPPIEPLIKKTKVFMSDFHTAILK